jgi:hypothetical protein
LPPVIKEITMNPRRIVFSIILTLALPCLVWAATPQTFMAQLTGAQEVPPVKTAATGVATFKLSPDGKSLHCQLKVTGLKNVTMAHIHLGQAGKNGTVLVWLYPLSGPPPALKPGSFTGVLAEGNITAKNLAGPLKGKPLSALLKDMHAGQTYVNVHTTAHPEGEIRGQIGPSPSAK